MEWWQVLLFGLGIIAISLAIALFIGAFSHTGKG